jgi:hypothetical protein
MGCLITVSCCDGVKELMEVVAVAGLPGRVHLQESLGCIGELISCMAEVCAASCAAMQLDPQANQSDASCRRGGEEHAPQKLANICRTVLSLPDRSD